MASREVDAARKIIRKVTQPERFSQCVRNVGHLLEYFIIFSSPQTLKF